MGQFLTGVSIVLFGLIFGGIGLATAGIGIGIPMIPLGAYLVIRGGRAIYLSKQGAGADVRTFERTRFGGVLFGLLLVLIGIATSALGVGIPVVVVGLTIIVYSIYTYKLNMENNKIIKINGKISSGGGNARKNFDPIKDLIEKRMGLNNLLSETLNIMLENHYPLTAVDAVITDEEYKHEKECIKLKRCKVNGRKCVILRPSQHENPQAPNLYKRIEVMSSIHFKNDLQWKNGDSVEIEIERGFEEDNDWWQK